MFSIETICSFPLYFSRWFSAAFQWLKCTIHCTVNGLFHFVFGMFSPGYSHLLAYSLVKDNSFKSSGSPFCIFFRFFKHLSFCIDWAVLLCMVFRNESKGQFLIFLALLVPSCSACLCPCLITQHMCCCVLSLLNWTFIWHSFLFFFGTIL